jgi:putative transcriptional regulator
MSEFMRQRKVRNRLLELIQERERERGRRIKQHEIAEFVGVSDHTIIHWIRNQTTKFDGQTIERLCDYFNCEISDLLYFEMVEVTDVDEKP